MSQVDVTSCQGVLFSLCVVLLLCAITISIVVPLGYVSSPLRSEIDVINDLNKHSRISLDCVCAFITQVPWLHATYAVLGAILFTMVGVKRRPFSRSCLRLTRRSLHSSWRSTLRCCWGTSVTPSAQRNTSSPPSASTWTSSTSSASCCRSWEEDASKAPTRSHSQLPSTILAFPPTTSCPVKGCSVCFPTYGHFISSENTTALLVLSLCLHMESRPFWFLHFSIPQCVFDDPGQCVKHFPASWIITTSAPPQAGD